jgi:capsular exopolysaccharide synthesis family protein
VASREDLKVIMVTSSLGGEGKTTTSANIAVTLAQAGKRVILISADLRKSRIHRFFGMRNDVGLATVLADVSADLAEVAKDPGIPNLRVVCGGPVPGSPAELLASRRSRDFIESLRAVSEFIIIDTPPVLAVADASILAALSDATLFLVDGERTKRSAVLQSRAQLENAGARVIGVVYNNFDPNQNAAYQFHYAYAEYASEPSHDPTHGNGQPSGNGSRTRPSKARSRSRRPQLVGFGQPGADDRP